MFHVEHCIFLKGVAPATPDPFGVESCLLKRSGHGWGGD